MHIEDSFPGQDEMIAKIMKHWASKRFDEMELRALNKEQLQRAAQWVRENPHPHHEPGTFNPRPIEPAQPVAAPRANDDVAVAKRIEDLPTWAQPIAARNLTRRTVPVEQRPPKYKAQVWHQGYMVHLGMFDSIEARDQAVRDAKARRAIGLPLRG